MPARAARPANAEEVAKAVHAYLDLGRGARAEGRARGGRSAHQGRGGAPRAAPDARARRHDRRPRCSLGGGGFYWVNATSASSAPSRRARRSMRRTASRSSSGSAGKPEDALAAARRALALARDGRRGRGAARARADASWPRPSWTSARPSASASSGSRTRRCASASSTCGSQQIDDDRQRARARRELDAAFAQAFHDYGVDLEGADLVPALKRIRERDDRRGGRAGARRLGTPAPHACTARSRRRPRTSSTSRWTSIPSRSGCACARRSSTTTWPCCSSSASPENLPKLAPGSIFVLSATLWDRFPEHRPDVYRMLRPGACTSTRATTCCSRSAGTSTSYAGRNEERADLPDRGAAACGRTISTRADTLADSLFYLGR